ncbi:hypothetical protein ACOME3_001208 [Neoechinorhynchus agilis]
MNDKNSSKKSKTCFIEDELSFNATDLSEAVKKANGDSKVLSFESVESSGINDSILPTRRSDGVCLKKGERFKDYVKTADSDIDATEVVHNLSRAIKRTGSYAGQSTVLDSSLSDSSTEFIPLRKSQKRKTPTRRLRSRSLEQTFDHSKFGSNNGDPKNLRSGEHAQSLRSMLYNLHDRSGKGNPDASKVIQAVDVSKDKSASSVTEYHQRHSLRILSCSGENFETMQTSIEEKTKSFSYESRVEINRIQFLTAHSSSSELSNETLCNVSSESRELSLKKSSSIDPAISPKKTNNHSSCRNTSEPKMLTSSEYDHRNQTSSSTVNAKATTSPKTPFQHAPLSRKATLVPAPFTSFIWEDLPTNIKPTRKGSFSSPMTGSQIRSPRGGGCHLSLKTTLHSSLETLINVRTSNPDEPDSIKSDSVCLKLSNSKLSIKSDAGAQGSILQSLGPASSNEPENRRPFDSTESEDENVISLKSPLRKDSIFRSKDKPPLGRELTADDRDQFETLLPSSHSNLPQFPQSTIYEPAVVCAEKETNQRNYLQSTMVAAGCNNESLAGLLPPLSPISKPGENKDMDEIFKGIGSLYVTGDGDICGDLSLVEVHDTPYGKKLILDPGRSSLYVIEPGKEIYDNDMESKRIVELFSPERLDIRRRGERCSIDRDVHVILIQKGTALMLYNKDECRRAVVKVTISD